MSVYECQVRVKVEFSLEYPVEVVARNKREAKDMAYRKFEETILNTKEFRNDLLKELEWFEPDKYRVIECRRID